MADPEFLRGSNDLLQFQTAETHGMQPVFQPTKLYSTVSTDLFRSGPNMWYTENLGHAGTCWTYEIHTGQV